jgi:hypothetical protein
MLVKVGTALAETESAQPFILSFPVFLPLNTNSAESAKVL